jgi:ADP-dependent NAD(P)H-hydrate dehydratase
MNDPLPACTRLDARSLRRWPLPGVADNADKEDRGRVLVVAGSREIAGAAQLAAVAALRAGAGKLVIATGESVALALAMKVPEARVIALPETAAGAFRSDSVAMLEPSAASAAAAVIGPGLMDEEGSIAFVQALLPLCAKVPVVLDALAMDVVRQRGRAFDQPVTLTPHAGEMAHLLGIDKEEVVRDAERVLHRACTEWNAVVALKGATTIIGSPGGGRWRHECGHPGLATSGSGDVLAGLIAGFAARGATPEQACAYGVTVHALAGAQLGRGLGPLGFLARELSGTVPKLLRGLEPSRVSR